MARQHDQALAEYLLALILMNRGSPGQGDRSKNKISLHDAPDPMSRDGTVGEGEGDELQQALAVVGDEVGNKEPLVMLLVGVTLLNIASTRAIKAQTMGRNRAVLSAFAFLDGYASERVRRAEVAEGDRGEEVATGGERGGIGSSWVQECKGEVSYNLGRAAHQLGQVHLARRHYLEVLELEGGACKFEAAHNLAMIYNASGARDAAREVYQRYLVIE